MPVPAQRDLEQTRTTLGPWIAERLGTPSVEVSEITTPSLTGFSSETLLFDATWRTRGTWHTEGFVARVAPTGYQIFYEPDFATQFHVMRALATTEVPVPAVHWYEEDPGLLGAPFFLMDKVEGRVPGDNPPYTQAGWLLEAPAAEQAALWWAGVEAMAAVHRQDWRALGLDVLDKPEWGKAGLDQQLGYYRAFLEWAGQGRPQPTTEAGLAWLEANRPDDDDDRIGLCWGDARVGNLLFADGRCAAVLDWEMVTLGNPVQDLAWFLFLDRHHAEGVDAPRLPGFGSREETVARWERLSGRTAEHLDYYEVFAAFRFAVVMIRVAQMIVEYGFLEADSDFETNNTVTQLLAKLLHLPAPGAKGGQA
jgi:aminoglycoside phosphotransferase (APT) family kinase protein